MKLLMGAPRSPKDWSFDKCVLTGLLLRHIVLTIACSVG